LNQKNWAIVLDFDGVITTLDIDWTKVRNEISSALNIEIDSFANFFEKNFGNSEFERVNESLKVREFSAVKRAEPYADVKPALEFIQENMAHA
jgi:hypothetical protein